MSDTMTEGVIAKWHKKVGDKIKTGELVAIKDVTDTDDLMIINKSGIVIRIGVGALRVMGRATQGVRLITFKGEDSIASVAKVEHEEEEEIEDAEIAETTEDSAEEATDSDSDKDTPAPEPDKPDAE